LSWKDKAGVHLNPHIKGGQIICLQEDSSYLLKSQGKRKDQGTNLMKQKEKKELERVGNAALVRLTKAQMLEICKYQKSSRRERFRSAIGSCNLNSTDANCYRIKTGNGGRGMINWGDSNGAISGRGEQSRKSYKPRYATYSNTKEKNGSPWDLEGQ